MLHVVWMDQRHAECFALHADGTFEHKRVIKHDPDHHTHGHRDDKHPPEKFFKELAQTLHGAAELLLVGPGLAKDHFRTYLGRHHATDLAKHVVGVETVDHPTAPQIQAMAIKAYKKLHEHDPVS